MNGSTTCADAEARDLVHRYVAGTLEPDERDRFETHLLECAACQEAVIQGIAVRAALREESGGSRRPPVMAWAIPLAAAATLAVWLILPSESAVERLGRVDQLPSFSGLPVRATADSAALLTDRGMAAYQDGDYRRAADLLAAAYRADSSIAVGFFLGVTQLKMGSAERAVESLAAALEPPQNPYAAEAHFYRAKAWLQLGQADSALAQLAAVPTTAARIHANARALADSVEQASR